MSINELEAHVLQLEPEHRARLAENFSPASRIFPKRRTLVCGPKRPSVEIPVGTKPLTAPAPRRMSFATPERMWSETPGALSYTG